MAANGQRAVSTSALRRELGEQLVDGADQAALGTSCAIPAYDYGRSSVTRSAITTEADDQRVGRADVVALIAQAVDLEPPRLAEGPMTDETPFGDDGLLDSLGLVALIVDVEEALSARTERRITLADDRAMSQTASPFRTVGSLADYALTLVREDG